MKNNGFIPNDDVVLLEEDIDHLITEDIDEYVRLAPVHNGKKVLSKRAWDVLWNKLFGKYEDREVFTTQEYGEYAKATREFGEQYECRL